MSRRVPVAGQTQSGTFPARRAADAPRAADALTRRPNPDPRRDGASALPRVLSEDAALAAGALTPAGAAAAELELASLLAAQLAPPAGPRPAGGAGAGGAAERGTAGGAAARAVELSRRLQVRRPRRRARARLPPMPPLAAGMPRARLSCGPHARSAAHAARLHTAAVLSARPGRSGGAAQAHVDAALGQPPPWAAYAEAHPRAPHVPWQLAAAELWRGSAFVAEALALALAAGGAAAARACAPLLVAGVADALAAGGARACAARRPG